MTAAETINFNSRVRIYMQDNMIYIRDAYEQEPTAADVLEFFEADDSALTPEQRAQFVHVAEHILRDGFYSHA